VENGVSTTIFSKVLLQGMVWKRSNAPVHFHHGPQRADAFIHNFEHGPTSATVSNITAPFWQ